MKRFALNLFLVTALILTLGLCLSVGGLAWAIPNSQQDCSGGGSTSSTDFEFIPDMQVTVNNGFFKRNCIVTFSSEATTDSTNGLITIVYAVDSTDPSSCTTAGFSGPEFFYRGTLQEGRTIVSVGELGPGFHTIRPCFSVTNASQASILFACLIVECWTK